VFAPSLSGRLRTSAARGLGVPPDSSSRVPDSAVVKGESGQAGLWSAYGQKLRDLAAQPDVELVLELGTWNGGGSSMALASGLMGDAPSAEDCPKLLVTMEAMTPMFTTARRLLSGLPVRLIHGTSMLAHELPTADEVEKEWVNGPDRGTWEAWLENDKAGARQFSVGMLAPLCAIFEWDLVHLDAGEFAGYKEWRIVSEVCKPRYVAMHDTQQLKNQKALQEALADKSNWALFASSDEAPGWAILKRVDAPGHKA
jgi:hypothetical protein